MTKEKFIEGLKGLLAFGVLADTDCFVLCLVSKKDKYFIPMLRKNGVGSAYIDPAKYDDAQYENISSLINTLNTYKIFTPIKYTPKSMVAPDFTKEVTAFIRPTGVQYALPKGIKQALEADGYVVKLNLGHKLPYTPRNYGNQIEDNPDFKLQYEAELNLLKSAKMTYDDLPEEIKINYESVASGAKPGIIFVGPTGTGKTWLSMALACEAKAHREDVQFTPDTQVEDLIGKYVADDRPDSKSNWRFVEGPLLKAYYLGYVFTGQEINYGSSGVNSCLNRYLDGTLQIEENGKIYHRHPNFVAYLTMNPGYEGTEELNRALKNRFSIIQVPAWTEQKYIEVLSNHSERLGHKLSPIFFQELLKFAATVEQTANGGGYHEHVKFSVRNAQRFLDTILLKPRTFTEFEAAFHSEYINLLSCDNDNSDKLDKYKKDEMIVNSIKKLYDLYDYSEIEESSKLADDLSDLFSQEEEEVEAIGRNDDITKKARENLANKYNL